MNKAPKIKNWTLKDKLSENKNPGNSARKKRVTLGFSTFMINPTLKSWTGDFFSISSVLIEITELLLNTL